MPYQIIPVTPFAQNCTLFWCEKTRVGVVIDPGGDVARILQAIQTAQVTVQAIVLTHGHRRQLLLHVVPFPIRFCMKPFSNRHDALSLLLISTGQAQPVRRPHIVTTGFTKPIAVAKHVFFLLFLLNLHFSKLLFEFTILHGR